MTIENSVEENSTNRLDGLSPKQKEMFNKAEIWMKNPGVRGMTDIVGTVSLDGKSVWIMLTETKSSDDSEGRYDAFIHDNETAKVKELQGERAKKLYDFYKPIAALKTLPLEPVKEPISSEDKNIEDELLGA